MSKNKNALLKEANEFYKLDLPKNSTVKEIQDAIKKAKENTVPAKAETPEEETPMQPEEKPPPPTEGNTIQETIQMESVLYCYDLEKMRLVACSVIGLSQKLLDQINEEIRDIKEGEKRKTIITANQAFINDTSRQRYHGKLNVVTVVVPAIPGTGDYPIIYKVYIGEDGYLSADVSDRKTATGFKQIDVDYTTYVITCIELGLS